MCEMYHAKNTGLEHGYLMGLQPTNPKVSPPKNRWSIRPPKKGWLVVKVTPECLKHVETV